jgi:hypothetical protein
MSGIDPLAQAVIDAARIYRLTCYAGTPRDVEINGRKLDKAITAYDAAQIGARHGTALEWQAATDALYDATVPKAKEPAP